jgi:hypothetical protein
MTKEDLKPIPWKPGQSGNPNGRPKSKPITDAIKALLDKDDGKALNAIAAVAVREALGGNYRYTKEILDRVEGKALEMLDVTTDGQSLNEHEHLTPEELAFVNKNRGGPE